MVLTFHPVPLEQMKVKGEGIDVVYEWDEHFASPQVPNYQDLIVENSGNAVTPNSLVYAADNRIPNGKNCCNQEKQHSNLYPT